MSNTQAEIKKTTLPNALIVGPQKAGTSWIQEYFKYRGDIHLPKGVKETFFFDKYYNKGIAWYKKHFVEINPERELQIEVAPTYFENDEVMGRVKNELGNTPIICTLRDPAKRTFSLYQHLRRYGMTSLPFRKAVADLNLYEGSLYAKRLQQWREVFGIENVYVLFLEDLARDHDAYAKQLCECLDIDYSPLPEHLKEKVFGAAASHNFWVAKITNTVAQVFRSLQLYSVVNFLKKTPLKNLIFGKPKEGQQLPKLSPEDRAWLLDNYFYNDILSLESLLGRTFEDWKTK